VAGQATVSTWDPNTCSLVSGGSMCNGLRIPRIQTGRSYHSSAHQPGAAHA
jgi:hypothetical protein